MTKEEIDNLSREQLFELERNLQQQSDLILEKLSILNTLSKYSKPEIVGSKRMGLMVKKDIDINCTLDGVNINVWTQVCSELLKTPHVRRITPINYYDYDNAGCLSEDNAQRLSYYISMEKLCIPDIPDSKEWEIQIHLLNGENEALKRADAVLQQLTDEKKELILRIKYYVKDVLGRASGSKRIDSPTIYDMILNQSVKSFDDFITLVE